MLAAALANAQIGKGKKEEMDKNLTPLKAPDLSSERFVKEPVCVGFDIEAYLQMSDGRKNRPYQISLKDLSEMLVTDIMNGHCLVVHDPHEKFWSDGCEHYDITPTTKDGVPAQCVFQIKVNRALQCCQVFGVPSSPGGDLVSMPEAEEDVSYHHYHPVHIVDIPDPEGTLAAQIEELSSHSPVKG